MTDMAEEAEESKPRQRGALRKLWIAVARDIFEHDIVGAPEDEPWPRTLVWLWMLAEAAYQDRRRTINGHTIHLRRGQLAVSERYLAAKVNWTRKMARSFLLRLQKHGMVSLSTVSRDGQLVLDFAGTKVAPGQGPTLTVVTFCNYDVYQQRSRTKGTVEGTKEGPARDQSHTRDSRQEEHRSSPKERKKEEDAYAHARNGGTDGASGERLPFSETVIREIAAFNVDVEDLVADFFKKTAGKRIRDPSAYLLHMAKQRAAKGLGITVAQFSKVSTGTKHERALEAANVVGAFSAPSDEALRRARRYRKPDEINTAISRLAGRRFTSQTAVDRALDYEFTVMRFSGRAA